MSFNRARALLPIAALVALSGCGTTNSHIGDEDPFMGEAVKYNAAIQTINPTPVYPAGAAQPGDNGVKGQAAVKRYRTDAVKPVETMSTSTSSGGGSTGGSGPH
jgi:hypothetical protein